MTAVDVLVLVVKRVINMSPPPSPGSNPSTGLAQPWVMIAGALFGALTLIFIMGLVLLGVAGHEVPCNTVFLVNITVSLGAALAAAFLGGNASAKGNIPFLQNSLATSVTGGLAALVIMLIVTFGLIGKNNCPPSLPNQAFQGKELVIWEKNLDALRGIGWMGSSAANECGYRNWTHREAYVGALNSLALDSAPELRTWRDQLVAAANNMPPKCGDGDWYDLAISPAMDDLHLKLLRGLRAKVIENGGHAPDR